jgi:hypothetical protein
VRAFALFEGVTNAFVDCTATLSIKQRAKYREVFVEAMIIILGDISLILIGSTRDEEDIE